MSIKYMTRVWATQELQHGRLILMLALADHANDAGECWPSQPHLEEKTRLTDRQLRRVIVGLVADGFLKIAEKGLGRGKKPLYRLFPPLEEKADILSEPKADILSKDETDKMSEISGNNVHEKADILDTKADISDAISSHARSESPIEPTTNEPKTESSSSEDEEEEGFDEWVEICEAWQDHFAPTEMTESIQEKLNTLLQKSGLDAVIHGIEAAAAANTRNYSYIAKCARNYVPPASNGHRYSQPEGYAPPTAIDSNAIAAEKQRVSRARCDVVERLHAPGPATLTFWQSVLTDVRLTIGGDHYRRIADASILTKSDSEVRIAVWDAAIYRELLHPNAVKPLERTIGSLAKQKLTVTVEFWNEAGRVVRAGERLPIEPEKEPTV